MRASLRAHVQMSPLSFVQAQTDLLILSPWPLFSLEGESSVFILIVKGAFESADVWQRQY